MDHKGDSIYSFAGGFLVSVFGNISWIAQIQNMSVNSLMIEWAIKIFGTMVLGIIGGVAGLFAKDLYKYLKDRLI
jgi:hypothetical protein